MPITTSFLEDISAKDELSTLTVGQILEMQTESTDRQAYPLWNNVNMLDVWVYSKVTPFSY